jgi:hypothetical protein
VSRFCATWYVFRKDKCQNGELVRSRSPLACVLNEFILNFCKQAHNFKALLIFVKKISVLLFFLQSQQIFKVMYFIMKHSVSRHWRDLTNPICCSETPYLTFSKFRAELQLDVTDWGHSYDADLGNVFQFVNCAWEVTTSVFFSMHVVKSARWWPKTTETCSKRLNV